MSCLSRLWQSGKRKLLNRPSKKFQKFISSGLTLADLRHTFATLSLQNGVDVKTLSNTLGHYSAGFTLDTYTHATQRMKREAADTIGSVIDQAM